MFPTNLDGDDDLVERAPALEAQLTTTDDGRTRCTIHPAAASDDDVTARWISAEEGSYIELPSTQ